MSDFYLCDLCVHFRKRLSPTTCACIRLGEVPMRAMRDHHGVGGVRYLEPREVCEFFERREDER